MLFWIIPSRGWYWFSHTLLGGSDTACDFYSLFTSLIGLIDQGDECLSLQRGYKHQRMSAVWVDLYVFCWVSKFLSHYDSLVRRHQSWCLVGYPLIPSLFESTCPCDESSACTLLCHVYCLVCLVQLGFIGETWSDLGVDVENLYRSWAGLLWPSYLECSSPLVRSWMC